MTRVVFCYVYFFYVFKQKALQSCFVHQYAFVSEIRSNSKKNAVEYASLGLVIVKRLLIQQLLRNLINCAYAEKRKTLRTHKNSNEPVTLPETYARVVSGQRPGLVCVLCTSKRCQRKSRKKMLSNQKITHVVLPDGPCYGIPLD